MSKWFKYIDYSPEKEGDYLVCTNGFMFTAKYIKVVGCYDKIERGIFILNNSILEKECPINNRIEYWQELPELPGKEIDKKDKIIELSVDAAINVLKEYYPDIDIVTYSKSDNKTNFKKRLIFGINMELIFMGKYSQ